MVEKFKEWLFQNTRLAKNSVETYDSQIEKLLKKYPDFGLANEKKLDRIRKFINSGERVYARRFAILRYLEYLREFNLIKTVKTERDFKIPLLDRKNASASLNYSELVDLINNIKNSEIRVALQIIFDTGLRITPVLNLTRNQLKQDNDGKYFISVREKGKKNVIRYLTDETAQNLINLTNKNSFFNLSYIRFWSILKNESRKILRSSYGISPHWVRRSSALYVYDKTKNLEVVREFLNHKSLDTTKRYLSGSGIELKSLVVDAKRDW